MALATWWRGDLLTDLRPLAGFTVRLAEDPAELARLNNIPVEEVQARILAGHRPYIGYLGLTPVAYGWAATRQASIGELDLNFPIALGERYLWDFATLPEWRGRGLYSRLLQAIVQAEPADRFWIIHAPENLPSGAGMQKAGFQVVGQLSFRPDGRVGLIPTGPGQRERAVIGADRLGVALIEDDLSPCWRCMDQVVCRCKLAPEQCSCAVPVGLRA
jgi:GNAT superfamily N-acetyltransferase